MNILFLLTPKSDTTYIFSDNTLRQAIGKFEHYRFSALPIIDTEGRYVGTITEGDMLWYIKNKDYFSLKEAENVPILDIPRKFINNPVNVDSTVEEIIAAARTQNFVPVIDDNSIYIGIVKRQDILSYMAKKWDEIKDHMEN